MGKQDKRLLETEVATLRGNVTPAGSPVGGRGFQRHIGTWDLGPRLRGGLAGSGTDGHLGDSGWGPRAGFLEARRGAGLSGERAEKKREKRDYYMTVQGQLK